MTTATGRIEHAGNADLARTLDGLGEKIIRYSMVAILLWVGALKFAAYEAEGIQGLVANSPLLSWGYSVLSVQSFAVLIGVIEITLGLLIATRPVAPKLSAIGSLGVIPMALITLTFVFTTPGVWQPGYGFPFLSMTGAFLAKDLLLLGAAVWTAGEALRAADTQSPRIRQERNI